MAVKLVARSAEATAVAAEVAALYDLNHRNIVPFIGWAEDDNFQCVVTEYMENGSLENYLISPGSTGGKRGGGDVVVGCGCLSRPDSLTVVGRI